MVWGTIDKDWQQEKAGPFVKYRTFGNSGIKLSALGFGGMRLPEDEDEAIRIVHRALHLGVHYLDPAPAYGENEVVVGKALASYKGGGIYLSTKNPLDDDTAAGWRQRLEKSLSRLGVSHIHFYQVVHALNWNAFETNFSKSGAFNEALKAKEEGLIGHICFSFHDTPQNLIRLIDTGLFEGCTVQYNLMDRANEDAITHAYEKGMGVVIMGPVGGGRLIAPSGNVQRVMGVHTSRTPEIALRFVLSHPGVTTAISGMNTMEMVEENCATADSAEPLSEEELADIRGRAEELKKLAELYCTGCGYCMPCPNDINIPHNFMLMNLHRVWGQTDRARRGYSRLGTEGFHVPGKKAGDCLMCGECEPKCPQHIPIIEQLKATAETLGDGSEPR